VGVGLGCIGGGSGGVSGECRGVVCVYVCE